MKYPPDFPPESRAAVAAEKLRAEIDFDKLRENPAPDDRSLREYFEAELRRCVLRQFIVFVREACKLGYQGVWSVDRVEEAAREFFRLATLDAAHRKGHGVIGGSWFSNWGGIKPEVMRQFERSDQWRQFQDGLLKVAEGQAIKAEDKQIAQQGLSATGPETDRRKMVDDFLIQCNEESSAGSKVTRKHIWLVVGHKYARQFQYWQKGSSNATEEDDRNFRRILGMAPAEFVILLNQKGLSSPNS
jgi:hypothetical protein